MGVRGRLSGKAQPSEPPHQPFLLESVSQRRLRGPASNLQLMYFKMSNADTLTVVGISDLHTLQLSTWVQVRSPVWLVFFFFFLSKKCQGVKVKIPWGVQVVGLLVGELRTEAPTLWPPDVKSQLTGGHPGTRTTSRACSPQRGLPPATCLSPEEGALPSGL